MSIDAYQIAVSMSLTNHVSSELAKMSKDFDKTGGHADKLRERIKKIKDLSLSGGGKSALGSGLSKELEENKAHADELIAKAKELKEATKAGAAGSTLGEGLAKGAEKAATRTDELLEKTEKLKKISELGKGIFESGSGMLEHLKEPLEKKMELERAKASLSQSGLGEAQVAEAMKFADATDIYGTSIVERTKILADAQIAFKESNKSGEEALAAAKTMMPVLANYKVAMGTLQGKDKEAQEESLDHVSELVEARGGLDKPGRAGEIADAVFKAVQSSKHAISEKDYLDFLKQSGGAADKMSDRTLFGGLQPMMSMMGGADLAKGMQAADQNFAGKTGVPSNEMAGEATRLGLWDKDQIQHDAKGNVKSVKDSDKLANPELLKLMRTEPLEFAKKLQEIYQAHGINSVDKRERENKTLFGEDGAKVYNAMMRNQELMEKSQSAFDAQRGPAAMNDPKNRSPIQAFMEAQAKYDDLLTRLGNVVLPMAVSALQVLTPMLQGLSEWMAENPKTVGVLVDAFVVLGTAMAIGGAATMAASAFSGLGAALDFAIIGGPAGIKQIAAALSGTGASLSLLTRASILATVAFASWELGKWLYDAVIQGTKFGNWLGEMIAKMLNVVGLGESVGDVSKSPEVLKTMALMEAHKKQFDLEQLAKKNGVAAQKTTASAPPPKDSHGAAAQSHPAPVVHVKTFVQVDSKELAAHVVSKTSTGTTGINPSAIRINPSAGSAGY